MKLRPEEIGLKLAAALLMHNKEIAVSDIRAIPFITTPDHVKGTVEYLMKTFDARIYSKQVSRHPMLEWDEIITLR
jgi:hypothetical protein